MELEKAASFLMLLHNGGFCNGRITKRCMFAKLNQSVIQ
jgi:hypothetical protein